MDDLWMDHAVNLIQVLDNNGVQRRPNLIREHVDGFGLPDNLFRSYFRLTKVVARQLVEELRPAFPAQRNSAVEVERKVLVALRFYATGSYQGQVGNDFTLAVCQSTVSRCLAEVTTAINDVLLDRYVKFPTTHEEQATAKLQFMELGHFPGIISAVDGTHVAIVAPPLNDPQYLERTYVNRKNYHSITTELACDANMMITSINARFPGATHDSHIWSTSSVRQYMAAAYENGLRNTWIISDSGYPLEPWNMIPILDVEPHTPEARYNKAHIRTRNVVERCIGLLKARFRCLLRHRTLHYHPRVAGHIINACAVLHNICVQNNLNLDLAPGEEIVNDEELLHQPHIPEVPLIRGRARDNLLNSGRYIQREIVQRRFTRANPVAL